jgi:hypothetical protein
VSRRLLTMGALAGVLVVALAAYFFGDDDGELSSPWLGLALVVAAAALFGLGWVAAWRGVLGGAVVTVACVAFWGATLPDDGGTTNGPGCDPACGGVSFAYGLVVVAIVALAVAGAGSAARSLGRRGAGRR